MHSMVRQMSAVEWALSVVATPFVIATLLLYSAVDALRRGIGRLLVVPLTP